MSLNSTTKDTVIKNKEIFKEEERAKESFQKPALFCFYSQFKLMFSSPRATSLNSSFR